jgi:hypothetical protein
MVYEIFSQFGKVSEVIIKGSQVNNRLQRQNGHGFIRFDGRTYEEGIEAAVRATKVIQQVLINEVLYDCVLSHSVTAAASALPNYRSPASGHYGSENVFTQPVVSSSRLTLYPSDDMRSYELRSYLPANQRHPLPESDRTYFPSTGSPPSLSSPSSAYNQTSYTSSVPYSISQGPSASSQQYSAADYQLYSRPQEESASFFRFNPFGPK